MTPDRYVQLGIRKDIAHPLHQYTTTSPFSWEPKADVAFKKLTQALTEAPVLTYPHSIASFILDTDASGTGIAGVLSSGESY